ncbi:MAG: hypothetical protein HY326_04800 [Chloroflexi bacterium]|nr:hypothetical protein [Chloroflexota bacterium]
MELFFDDQWIDHLAGVRRILGQPVKEATPVLKPDRLWESGGVYSFYWTFWDAEERKFKMWYRSRVPRHLALRQRHDPNDQVESSEIISTELQYYVCYAESADGFAWTKPDLGLSIFQGSAANNILYPSGNNAATIIKDPADPDPAKRYKAIGFTFEPASRVPVRGDTSRGVCVSYSPDGLRWPTGPKLIMSTTDLTDSNLPFPTRDPHTHKWVLYMRPRVHPKRRFIGFAESDDFEHWSYPRMLLTPDARDSEYLEFYALSAVYLKPYYVGLLWLFHNHPAYSPMTTELVYSRDGQHYERAMPGTEFLPLGSAGQFDSRQIFPMGIIPRGDELYFYYYGANYDHGADRGQPMSPAQTVPGEKPVNGIGLARLRQGMFCGYRADFEGMLETKFVTNYGGAGPRVLAQIDPGGSLQAEILDHYGQVLPGWEREKCRMVPQDDGTIGFAWGDQSLAGQLDDQSPEGGRVQRVIKLRFFLRQAQIFGLIA